jgi:hypothetical protein
LGLIDKTHDHPDPDDPLCSIFLENLISMEKIPNNAKLIDSLKENDII